MVELRFVSRHQHQVCCAKQARTKTFGSQRAGALARRLAQLDAIEALDDLACLPFDCDPYADGSLRVSVTAGLDLVIRAIYGQQGDLVAVEVTDIINKEE